MVAFNDFVSSTLTLGTRSIFCIRDARLHFMGSIVSSTLTLGTRSIFCIRDARLHFMGSIMVYRNF